MRKISLCAIAAAMVAIGFGVWNASTGARVVAPSLVQGIEGIDPHQVMMNTKGLATAKLVDYTFVFLPAGVPNGHRSGSGLRHDHAGTIP
jgi:hypothetical protein